MKAAKVDEKRRLVMPRECPPGAKMTIEQLDPFTWVVRMQPAGVRLKRVLIPVVDKLHRDRDKEKMEEALARAAYAQLPPAPED